MYQFDSPKQTAGKGCLRNGYKASRNERGFSSTSPAEINVRKRHVIERFTKEKERKRRGE
jgi:hypothetical protein